MGMYQVIIFPDAKEHLADYKKSGNKAVLTRIDRIFKELKLHPEFGIGNPKMLKYEKSGRWSREIDKKNRMIYEIQETEIIVYIHSAKGHHDDH
jgi:toxin YoeB